MAELSEGNLSCELISCLKYAAQQFDKPENFWNFLEVLWTHEQKLNSLPTTAKDAFGENQGKHLKKRTPCQLLSMGVDLLYFLNMWQPVAEEKGTAGRKNGFNEISPNL